MKTFAIFALLLFAQVYSKADEITITNQSEAVQFEQLFQRFVKEMREEYFNAPTNSDIDRSYLTNISFLTNLDTPIFRETFQRMIVHPSFGYHWDEIPAPTMIGSNSMSAVESFVATNGWNMYSIGYVWCAPGTNKTVRFRGLPWTVIHDREFDALTDSGIFYVPLRGFGCGCYGVAYNPMTNTFPKDIQGFKHIGQHWYAWVMPDMRVDALERRYEGDRK